MGSTLRRLRIYYINNVKASKAIVVFMLLFVLYFLSKLLYPSGSRFGVVRSKYEEEAETGYHTDEEIQRYIDALQDTRPIICRDQAYDFTRLDNHEPVSIITEFSGKQFYNLQLTLASIVEHTPYDLYQEIVIIDDGTSDPLIKKQAAQFLKNPRYGKVKMFRSETVDGQSATRYKGSQLATGDILIYVSHSTVVNHGWIQPLLAHVAQDHSIIVVPHSDNLLTGHRFYRTDDSLVPVFSWSFYTVYMEWSHDQGLTDLIGTPVMRGDVLAVRKSTLQSIGNFDEHMKGIEVGAGHHLELSLRAWMCGGGGVKIATCSRVATHNSLRPQHVTDQSNYRRIVELWFDDYKHLAYRQGQVSEALTEEDTTGLQLRRSHLKQIFSEGNSCQDIRWYIQNVLKDIPVPSRRMTHYGKVKAKTNYCLRVIGGDRRPYSLDMSLCRQHIYDKNMMFEMNSVGWIFAGERCLQPDDVSGVVRLDLCVEGERKQQWRMTNGKIGHVVHPGKCLSHVTERDESTLELVHYPKLVGCVSEEGSEQMRLQTWEFIHY